nr:uncharacterized protein LOC105843841 isoform X2 [Hydra vulgaris]
MNDFDVPVLQHAPWPTPSRAIYGFVLYVLTYVIFERKSNLILLEYVKLVEKILLKNIMFIWLSFKTTLRKTLGDNVSVSLLHACCYCLCRIQR